MYSTQPNEQDFAPTLTADQVPQELRKISAGLRATLDREEICTLNYPNYPQDAILVERLHLTAGGFDPALNGNRGRLEGVCTLPPSAPFPECCWDHLASTLFAVIINQAGKAAQSLCTTKAGIALRKLSCKLRKPSPLHNVTITAGIYIYVKMRALWTKSHWSFFHGEDLVAEFDALSLGVDRDYSRLAEQRRRGT